jgi:hypothetical protein
MKNMKRKTTRKKRVPNEPSKAGPIISEEFIQGVRNSLKEIENLHLEKRELVFSNAMRMMLTYRCMAEFTMDYCPSALLERILRDTENVANKIGASMNPDMEGVNKCLTKKHEECSGSYVKLVGGGTITCRCHPSRT